MRISTWVSGTIAMTFVAFVLAPAASAASEFATSDGVTCLLEDNVCYCLRIDGLCESADGAMCTLTVGTSPDDQIGIICTP